MRKVGQILLAGTMLSSVASVTAIEMAKAEPLRLAAEACPHGQVGTPPNCKPAPPQPQKPPQQHATPPQPQKPTPPPQHAAPPQPQQHPTPPQQHAAPPQPQKPTPPPQHAAPPQPQQHAAPPQPQQHAAPPQPQQHAAPPQPQQHAAPPQPQQHAAPPQPQQHAAPPQPQQHAPPPQPQQHAAPPQPQQHAAPPQPQPQQHAAPPPQQHAAPTQPQPQQHAAPAQPQPHAAPPQSQQPQQHATPPQPQNAQQPPTPAQKQQQIIQQLQQKPQQPAQTQPQPAQAAPQPAQKPVPPQPQQHATPQQPQNAQQPPTPAQKQQQIIQQLQQKTQPPAQAQPQPAQAAPQPAPKPVPQPQNAQQPQTPQQKQQQIIQQLQQKPQQPQTQPQQPTQPAQVQPPVPPQQPAQTQPQQPTQPAQTQPQQPVQPAQAKPPVPPQTQPQQPANAQPQQPGTPASTATQPRNAPSAAVAAPWWCNPRPGTVGCGAPPSLQKPIQPKRNGPPAIVVVTDKGEIKTIGQLHDNRTETKEGNFTIIREPDRTIWVDNKGQVFIQHDDTNRFRYGARDVRVDRRGDDTVSTIWLPNGERVVTTFDARGRMLRRARFLRDGNEIVLIDQRPQALDYDYVVNLPPPTIRIPRDRYIVNAAVASEQTIYDALMAAPVEKLERPYSLDEIRQSVTVRERMPSVDVDTINFDLGSWEVESGQVGHLAAIADALKRALTANPREIFLIEGHTDAVGTDVDNMSLSDRRAETVALILSQRYAVPAENLVTQGYGRQFPLIQSAGPERRNRRVTVRRITPLLAGAQ